MGSICAVVVVFCTAIRDSIRNSVAHSKTQTHTNLAHIFIDDAIVNCIQPMWSKEKGRWGRDSSRRQAGAKICLCACDPLDNGKTCWCKPEFKNVSWEIRAISLFCLFGWTIHSFKRNIIGIRWHFYIGLNGSGRFPSLYRLNVSYSKMWSVPWNYRSKSFKFTSKCKCLIRLCGRSNSAIIYAFERRNAIHTVSTIQKHTHTHTMVMTSTTATSAARHSTEIQLRQFRNGIHDNMYAEQPKRSTI